MQRLCLEFGLLDAFLESGHEVLRSTRGDPDLPNSNHVDVDWRGDDHSKRTQILLANPTGVHRIEHHALPSWNQITHFKEEETPSEKDQRRDEEQEQQWTIIIADNDI